MGSDLPQNVDPEQLIQELQGNSSPEWLHWAGLTGPPEKLAATIPYHRLQALHNAQIGLPYSTTLPSTEGEVVVTDRVESEGRELGAIFSATTLPATASNSLNASASPVPTTRHDLSSRWATATAAVRSCSKDPVFGAALHLLMALYRDPETAVYVPLDDNRWVSKRLTQLLSRQLADPLAIATATLPDWCRILTRGARFVLSIRQNLLFRLPCLLKHTFTAIAGLYLI